jgi:hypothetical protein
MISLPDLIQSKPACNAIQACTRAQYDLLPCKIALGPYENNCVLHIARYAETDHQKRGSLSLSSPYPHVQLDTERMNGKLILLLTFVMIPRFFFSLPGLLFPCNSGYFGIIQRRHATSRRLGCYRLDSNRFAA